MLIKMISLLIAENYFKEIQAPAYLIIIGLLLTVTELERSGVR